LGVPRSGGEGVCVPPAISLWAAGEVVEDGVGSSKFDEVEICGAAKSEAGEEAVLEGDIGVSEVKIEGIDEVEACMDETSVLDSTTGT